MDKEEKRVLSWHWNLTQIHRILALLRLADVQILVEVELLSGAWAPPKERCSPNAISKDSSGSASLGQVSQLLRPSSPGRDAAVLACFCSFWKQCCISGCPEVLEMIPELCSNK